jgi:hypothetical protein
MVSVINGDGAQTDGSGPVMALLCAAGIPLVVGLTSGFRELPRRAPPGMLIVY